LPDDLASSAVSGAAAVSAGVDLSSLFSVCFAVSVCCVSVWEVVIGALIGVGAIVGIGYFRSLGELTITSSTSPIYTLQSRADFTLHVLNLLDFIGGNFGVTHGSMLASSIPGSDLGPRMMVGKLIAWRTEVTVTPTLIGQMVVDFGKVGALLEMTLLGFILGIGFKIMQKTKNYFYIAIYSLILTYSILGVETGILDIQVLLYFAIAIFIYAINIVKSRN
jgi:oligosaccharide repeat unit polymerase